MSSYVKGEGRAERELARSRLWMQARERVSPWDSVVPKHYNTRGGVGLVWRAEWLVALDMMLM